MSIINKLATSIGRKDDVPNQVLAKEIALANDNNAIKELIENLINNKDKNIKSDCIKVLYETGYIKPELISNYYKDFIKLLKSKNNRLVWGSMIALDTITEEKPKEIYKNLIEILEATDSGSVITKDHGIGILIKLASNSDFQKDAFPLLMEQLRICVPKQLPMYAERSLLAINKNNKNEFIELLYSRMSELEKDNQKKRIEKVIKKIN